jgi:hypothetical protein
MHEGQAKAYVALREHRFKALRCGRRFGKTDFAKMWIKQGLIQGYECAWFAPQHMTWSEVYSDLVDTLQPFLETSSKGAAIMRLCTGGLVYAVIMDRLGYAATQYFSIGIAFLSLGASVVLSVRFTSRFRTA